MIINIQARIPNEILENVGNNYNNNYNVRVIYNKKNIMPHIRRRK